MQRDSCEKGIVICFHAGVAPTMIGNSRRAHAELTKQPSSIPEWPYHAGQNQEIQVLDARKGDETFTYFLPYRKYSK